MKKVAVYGSLRYGQYNFNSFKKEYPTIEYLSTHKIHGWELYSFHSYPGAIFTGSKGTLFIDILLIPNEAKFDMDEMEIGAGYQITEIDIDGEHIDIYEYKDQLYCKDQCERVESGDWVKYLKNKLQNA